MAQGQTRTEECSCFCLGWRAAGKNLTTEHELLQHGTRFSLLLFPQWLPRGLCWVPTPRWPAPEAQRRDSKSPLKARGSHPCHSSAHAPHCPHLVSSSDGGSRALAEVSVSFTQKLTPYRPVLPHGETWDKSEANGKQGE